jgi:hypothetical protein
LVTFIGPAKKVTRLPAGTGEVDFAVTRLPAGTGEVDFCLLSLAEKTAGRIPHYA